MASRTNTIKTNIEANSEGFINAMNEVKRSMATVRTEFKSVNEIMKDTGNTTDSLREHKKTLSTELQNTEASLKVLRDGLKKSIELNGEDSEATRIAREEVNKAEAQYYSLKNELNEVNKKLDEQTFSLASVSKAFGKVSEVAGKFANKVKWLSAGATSLLGLSAKTAIDFEDAFVGVKKTVEGTDEQLEQIRKDIINLSKAIPISTTELFELAEEAGQLGIATDNITTFTETMAKLGTATNLSAVEAGEAIATFVNVMGTLPENYERIGSVIVELGNNSKATESDIVAMAQRMSGAAATMGMTEADVLGLATALSSVGLEAEMGGTAISRIMNDFNRAASGVETKYGSLSQYAKICGMSTKEFANAVKNNAGEAIKQFVIGLGDSNRTGKETIKLLSDLGVNEVRLTDTMLRLANASGTVDEYMVMANAEWEENNALNIEAAKKYADTASQIEIAKNKFGELADKFGKILLPTINDLLTKVGKFADWLGNLDEKTQRTIVSATAFTAALFPIAKGIEKVTGTIRTVTNAMNKIKQSEKIMSAFSKGWTGLGNTVTKVIGFIKPAISGLFTLISSHPIIAGITLVIGAIILLWNKCEWFRNLVTNAFNAIKNVCSKVFDGIKNVVITVWDNIKKVWQPVQQFFTKIWNAISSSLKPVVDSMFNMFNEAWLLIKTIWDLVVPFFQAIWEGIKVVFSVVADVIGGVFVTAWNIIKGVWDFVAPYFQAIWEVIKTIFSVVSTVISGYFQVAWTLIKGVWDGVVQYFQLVWTGIKAVFSVVATVIGGAFQVAWNVIKAVWDTVTGYFKAIFDTIAGIFSVIRNVLTGNFSDAWEGIKGIVGTWADFFKGVWNSISGVFGSVVNFFKNIFSSAWNAIKSVFSGVGSFFSGIWNTIKSTFTNIGQKIGDTMSGAFKGAVNGLLSAAEKVLNVPINAINKAIGVINTLPGVNIGKMNTFSLPRLAEGTVLEKGARTVIAGEDGAEAIVPLERNTKWINRVAEQFKTAFIDTTGINTDYLGQAMSSSYGEEYLASAVNLLERILDKPSDTYLDGRKISEATASSDDKASGDLLEKLERGWAI